MGGRPGRDHAGVTVLVLLGLVLAAPRVLARAVLLRSAYRDRCDRANLRPFR